MDQAIDSGRRCHRILEDLFPLRERQIAREHHGAPFIPLCQKDEQHFHLLAVLLDVADIVDDKRVVF